MDDQEVRVLKNERDAMLSYNLALLPAALKLIHVAKTVGDSLGDCDISQALLCASEDLKRIIHRGSAGGGVLMPHFDKYKIIIKMVISTLAMIGGSYLFIAQLGWLAYGGLLGILWANNISYKRDD